MNVVNSFSHASNSNNIYSMGQVLTSHLRMAVKAVAIAALVLLSAILLKACYSRYFSIKASPKPLSHSLPNPIQLIQDQKSSESTARDRLKDGDHASTLRDANQPLSFSDSDEEPSDGANGETTEIEFVTDRPYSAQTNDKHGDRGAIYTGQWKDNRPHGKGVMVYPNAIYEGVFVDGEQTGYGKLMKANREFPEDDSRRYEECEYYQGDFVKGVRHGFGKVYRPRQNGRMPPGTFIGQYKDGQSDGFGILWTCRNVYIGQYQRNSQCGFGLSFDPVDQTNTMHFNQGFSLPTDSTNSFVHPITIGLVDRINNMSERKAAATTTASVSPEYPKIAFDQAVFSELSQKLREGDDAEAFYRSIFSLDFNEALTNPEHMDNLKKIVHLFEICFLNQTFSPVIDQYLYIYEQQIESLL